MPDADGLEQGINSAVTLEQKMRYTDAVCELLTRIRPIWIEPAPDNSYELETAGSAVSPFESFLGVPCDSANIEPVIRNVVDWRDTDESLKHWLADIPFRIFSNIAYEMGCPEVDRAKTIDEAVKTFLERFGYVDKTDRKPPEGIFAARLMIEDAKRKLVEFKTADIDTDSIKGIGTNIASAIESTLQLMVIFYGQFVMADLFRECLQQKAKLAVNSKEWEEWWEQVKCRVTPDSIRGDIKKFLISHRTQLELTIRILETLNNFIPSQPALATQFQSAFSRDSIFPAIESKWLPARIGGKKYGEFLEQLKKIKELRNKINHAVQLLHEGKVTLDPDKLFTQVRELADISGYFFETGQPHRLFPEVILVTGISLNIRRRWKIHAIDERNNEFSFPVPETRIGTFVPDCEVLCWPPEQLSSGTPVALIKLWRE